MNSCVEVASRARGRSSTLDRVDAARPRRPRRPSGSAARPSSKTRMPSKSGLRGIGADRAARSRRRIGRVDELARVRRGRDSARSCSSSGSARSALPLREHVERQAGLERQQHLDAAAVGLAEHAAAGGGGAVDERRASSRAAGIGRDACRRSSARPTSTARSRTPLDDLRARSGSGAEHALPRRRISNMPTPRSRHHADEAARPRPTSRGATRPGGRRRSRAGRCATW